MHLLLTNDYPPKVGGIQTYLWQLWRRFPPDEFAVFTSPHDDSAGFDARESYRIERHDRFWLPPTRRVLGRVQDMIRETGASAVMIDPAFPLGALGPQLGVPYGVVVHGAEVTVPARFPISRTMLRRALLGAEVIISSGDWVLDVAADLCGSDVPRRVFVPPGVELDRFEILSRPEREATRRRLGFVPDAPLVVGVSRLVPRKGFDTLIRAAATLSKKHPGLQVAIAGTGRDEARLRRLIAQTGAPAKLLGYVSDEELPALYGCADVFAMLCRNRWADLEQEGFGIVFVEAAAAGCPQIAGASGGSSEAVAAGETGYVIDPPDDPDAVAAAIDAIIANPAHREQLAAASRRHAEANFDWDDLAKQVQTEIAAL